MGSETELRYPSTLLISFLWLSITSLALTAVLTRWGELLGIPPTILGMYVVAIGAQIPDTVQAVAVARRGHGPMAISSAVGSQVINILLGAGVPWFMSNSAEVVIYVDAHGVLHAMTCARRLPLLTYVASSAKRTYGRS